MQKTEHQGYLLLIYFLNQTCNNFSDVWELIESWSTHS